MSFTKNALPPLVEIAVEAGDMIAAMQADIVATKNWEIKPDNSPVTPADKAAHQLIKQRLAERFPGLALVSEEGEKEDTVVALKARDRFDTDPLDNTGGFIKGLDGYSVNIGRIVDGRPTEGVVYFPARKEIFYTQDGKAFHQKGDAAPQEIRVKGLPLRKPLQVATGFREQKVEFMEGRDYEIQKHPAQYRTCMVAMGQCDTSGLNKGPVAHYDSWDVGGAHAVLLAAGGDFITEEGKPVHYSDSTSKVPAYIAGGVDTLKALGLADPAYFKSARIVGA